ncbi:Rv3235 family protein [Streptomyces lydicus]|uniref:Rv3235 family protein n=1 Tax=Streptomyces lydicus TaxID=47763 RepID=UPI000AE95621|nr:Rv3235 family protein [Streptomyces lydicus]
MTGDNPAPAGATRTTTGSDDTTPRDGNRSPAAPPAQPPATRAALPAPRPPRPAPATRPAPSRTAALPRPRTGPTGPATAPAALPRPRRSPGAGRRPLGPAGSGPRTTGPALPTVGAQRRARESRPHLWFAHQLVLTLSGQRPVHALLGHALPAAYDRLAELAPQAPLRPLLAPGHRAPVPALRECGLCRPRRGVIEAFARIATGERLRALAFRLELGADSRWRCAALDIGPAPAARPSTP